MDFFKKDNRDVLQSIEHAQQIAFAPVVFQASRALRNAGLLTIIEKAGKSGISMQDVTEKSKLSAYGARVLMEAGLGIGLLTCDNDLYKITKAGAYILHDAMTIANMDFVHDVCYKGLFDLDKSIEHGKPEGLKVFGTWKTVYEALSKLPADVQKSWFAFDHFYSDDSFPLALPHVFKGTPKRILDIGGNTGKWTLKCLGYNGNIQMGIVDLPGQLNMAKKNIEEKGFTSRVSFHEANLLDKSTKLPTGYEIIWMSQFLDCFSEDEIVSILQKCYDALDSNGQVYIMETFWDRQKYEVSAFSLQMTSLYFTNIANGNSQMYSAELFRKLVEKAGFIITEQIDEIGVSHSLLKCKKK